MLVPAFKINLLFFLLLSTAVIPVASQITDNAQQAKVKSRQLAPAQYEVTCFESAEYCAEEFKRLCPGGHRVGGYFRNQFDHGQITAVITCQENN